MVLRLQFRASKTVLRGEGVLWLQTVKQWWEGDFRTAYVMPWNTMKTIPTRQPPCPYYCKNQEGLAFKWENIAVLIIENTFKFDHCLVVIHLLRVMSH